MGDECWRSASSAVGPIKSRQTDGDPAEVCGSLARGATQTGSACTALRQGSLHLRLAYLHTSAGKLRHLCK